MGIEITSGGVSKTFRYYPYDAFYIDANGNLNTSGDGQQVMEAYFNGTKYYPEGFKPPAKLVVTRSPSLADYSDIIVVAYTDDNEVWYDPSYPNGVIPFNELYISKRGTYSTECGVSPQDTYVAHNTDAHIGGTLTTKLQDCLGEVMYTPITYVAGDSAAVNSERFYSQVADSGNWDYCFGYVGQDVYTLVAEGSRYVNMAFYVPFTRSTSQSYIESVSSYGRIQFQKSMGNTKCTVDTSCGRDGVFSNTNKQQSMDESNIFYIGDKAVYFLYSYRINIENVTEKEVSGNATIYKYRGNKSVGIVYGVQLTTMTGSSSHAFWNWYYGGPVEYDYLNVSWRGHGQVSSVNCTTNPRQIAS